MDNKNGLLSSLNAFNLKNSIIKILNDKKLQKKITNNALNLIKKNNSLSRFKQREMKIIKKLCKN